MLKMTDLELWRKVELLLDDRDMLGLALGRERGELVPAGSRVLCWGRHGLARGRVSERKRKEREEKG